MATRCMNKKSILITVFAGNCLHILTSCSPAFLSLFISPICLFILSNRGAALLISCSSSSRSPSAGVNEWLGRGRGLWLWGSQWGSERWGDALPVTSQLLFSLTRLHCQEQDGTGLLDYLLERLPGPESFVQSSKTNWSFIQICLSLCQQMRSEAAGAGETAAAHIRLFKPHSNS